MAPTTPVGNLSALRTPLIGRAQELATLADFLLHDDEQLLTISGVGGCGKTRLALQLAADFAPAFPHRIWFVELAPITDHALVAGAIASTIGLRDAAEHSSVEALTTFLAPQPALLVLDNCEHLIDACAALADHLLTACPFQRILATSREPLQIPGERQYRLAPLAVPDVDRLPGVDALAQSPSVQLFVSRAEAMLSGFALTDENAPPVAGICARLDGIPLALELAAAWMRSLAPAQILARLDDSFRLLVGGSRVAPTRQQTLRAALDWSDALLTAEERTLFQWLAVFAGEFTLDAVEGICAEATIPTADVLVVLTRLVDKSLVVMAHREGRAWYRLLEPVRQYALEHLTASGEHVDAQARHARWYLQLAEDADPALRGPEQVVWLSRLEREQGNLRAALTWAHETHAWVIGLRLAVALVPFWEAHAHLGEGRRWLAQALAAPPDAVPPALRMRVLTGAGRLSLLHAASAEAERLHTQSLALAREIGDEHGIATALTELGMVTRQQREFERSLRYVEEGLARFRALGDEAGIAVALLNLGCTIGEQGDAPGAATLLNDARARCEALGDLRLTAIAQALLSMVLLMQRDLDAATENVAASLTGHATLGDRFFVTYCLMALVSIQVARERWEAAARMLGAAEAIGAGVSSSISTTSYEGIGATIRGQFGDEGFTAAWEAGYALTMEEAVAQALEIASPAVSEPKQTPPPVQPVSDNAPLTRREREIVQLLARGYTDRQIAETLFLTAGTVGWHVHRILQKLDLHSRRQVADWLRARTREPLLPDHKNPTLKS